MVKWSRKLVIHNICIVNVTLGSLGAYLVAVVVRLAEQLAVEPVAVPVAVLDVLAAEPELLVKYEAMEGLEMLDDHVRMQQQGSVFPNRYWQKCN